MVHNDDTSMKVLKLEREPGDERTGVFTSGIVSTGQGQKIALYFTGRQHAGENIADVLKQRAKDLNPEIQMCDALSRNVLKLPRGVEILVANCLAHYLDSGLIRSDCDTGTPAEVGMRRAEFSPQIRRHKLSRNASSFGDGRHFRGAAGSSPARFQKASSTSRFI